MRIALLLSCVAWLPACVSEELPHPEITKASAIVDPAKLDAQAEVSVTLALVGGDRDRVTELNNVALGDGGLVGPIVILDLSFATPTIAVASHDVTSAELVPGHIPNRVFRGMCNKTVPITAALFVEDADNMVVGGPTGAMTVTCVP